MQKGGVAKLCKPLLIVSEDLEGEALATSVEGHEAKRFDARKERYVNVFETGIIDPAKVVRCVLRNAALIAALMSITEAVMSEFPEEGKSATMGAQGMGGDVYRAPALRSGF